MNLPKPIRKQQIVQTKKKIVIWVFASIKQDFKRNPSADSYQIRHINFCLCFCTILLNDIVFCTEVDRCCVIIAKIGYQRK